MAQTPIQGPSQIEGGWPVAQEWARSRNAHPIYVANAPLYWWFATMAGLRPEVMYAHHAKETGFCHFGGVLDASFHNAAGIKLAQGGGDFDPDAHERFPSWEDGVRAHVNHMLAYVHGKDAKFIGEPHGRARTVQTISWSGTVRHVEELNGKWAPSPTYGQDLVRIFLNSLMAYSAANPPVPDPVPIEVTKPVLRRGVEGHTVRVLQGLMIAHTAVPDGWPKGAADFVDGRFGESTEAALRDWQRRTGALDPTGIADEATWRWLLGA